MTFQVKRRLELGGGANPLIQPDGINNICVDVRGTDEQGNRLPVNFVADFNEALPIADNDFDEVIARFVIEHLSWRKVRQFVSEIFRVLKPSGKALIITANTEAQFEWIKNKGYEQQATRKADVFEDCSCIIFGDQDYEANTHKNYLSPSIAEGLFAAMGFRDISIKPYGDIKTDIFIEAIKPSAETADLVTPNKLTYVNPVTVAETAQVNPILTQEQGWIEKAVTTPAQEKFTRRYFDGGDRIWGGYGAGGYWDYPVHELTARHILSRKPLSVLELGCARGYILKRIQDAGIRGCGLEVSRHAWMTRVCDGIIEWDITTTPWPFRNEEFDLCYSVGVLDHIPQALLPSVFKEMARTCKRGVHGINPGPITEGDRTRCNFGDEQFWKDLINRCMSHVESNYIVEILNKDVLESGQFPQEVLRGDGRLKLNLGSFTTMFHHGWMNVDVHDLSPFAQANGYNYVMFDVTSGPLPWATGVVDRIFSAHMLEHLTYEQGITLLRECRRIIRLDGAMRIIVPDAYSLIGSYCQTHPIDSCQDTPGQRFPLLYDFDNINENCEKAPTQAGKLFALLHDNHKALYDAETLCRMLNESGWDCRQSVFRVETNPDNIVKGSFFAHPGLIQIGKETSCQLPCLSLFVDAIPLIG